MDIEKTTSEFNLYSELMFKVVLEDTEYGFEMRMGRIDLQSRRVITTIIQFTFRGFLQRGTGRYRKGVDFNGRMICIIRYADDTVVLAENEEHFGRLLNHIVEHRENSDH